MEQYSTKRYSHLDQIQNSKYGFNTNKTNLNSPEYANYNPHYAFLQKHGHLHENTKTITNELFLNINSACRTKQSKITKGDEILLNSNALSFNQLKTYVGIKYSQQTTLCISIPRHNFAIGDKITLTGLLPSEFTINTVYYDSMDNMQYSVIFTEGSRSVAIICNYDENMIPSPMSFIPNFDVGMGIAHLTLQMYDVSNMHVELSGFGPQSFIGNIPINFLNSTHNVYFTNPDYTIVNGTKIYSPDTIINVPINGIVQEITGFYILLDNPYTNNNNIDNMTITMQFDFIGGIPINYINTENNNDNNCENQYHTIIHTTNNSISIPINKMAYYNKIKFGTNVYISKITDVQNGYNTPSHYKIPIQKITNVIGAKLINHSIPNTSYAFYSNGPNKNNKLYWQNQNDDDCIYNIEITEGNYTAKELEYEIETKVSNIPRQQQNQQLQQQTQYTGKNIIKVDININTNIATFKSFTEAILKKSIQSITPQIPSTGQVNDSDFIITILHENHGLQSADTILFTKMISTMGIDETILNNTHIVQNVLNENMYTILLQNINISDTRIDTAGGFATRVYTPTKFKLLFEYDCTIGPRLGFKNVNTQFNTIIKNTDTNNGFNLINLKNDNYILMQIDELTNCTNYDSSNVKSFFAKIDFKSNEIVDASTILYNPINLSELTVTFYSPNGNIFDFYGIDHSYMLQLTYIENVPEETSTISGFNVA